MLAARTLELKNELKPPVIDPYSQPIAGADAPAGTFNLHEKRRVKLNEVHYFDHPYFGALVRVSRWPPNGGADSG